jgi:hypothetical protein
MGIFTSRREGWHSMCADVGFSGNAYPIGKFGAPIIRRIHPALGDLTSLFVTALSTCGAVTGNIAIIYTQPCQ